MSSKDQEYQELFLAESLDIYNDINRLLTQLEKNPDDAKAIQSLFRVTHTLKGNATGMGFDKIADLSHVLEDLFGEIRDGNLSLESETFDSIFKAVDILGNLINAIKTPKDVKYLGIKTKLQVITKNVKQQKEHSNKKSPSTKRKNSTKEKNGVNEEIVADTDARITFSDLVQVPVKKLDDLLDLVSELVIEKDRMMAVNLSHSSINEYSRLSRISSDLQYSVMDVRLVQVGFLFNKFHRIVRDAASTEEKKVRLILEGTETEIDRNILQVISDSLIHLIRNAIGHGIEKPKDREADKKDPEGTITLSARSESDTVYIKIHDDGRGIDIDKVKKKAVEKGIITRAESEQLSNRDAMMLIFEPGFSTMSKVTSISGRGVGMDVVKKALDSIGGSIEVNSLQGEGSGFLLSLPSSMAVKSTMLFELENQVFSIPLSHTESVISIQKTDIRKASNGLIAVHQGDTIGVLFLLDLLFLRGSNGRFNSFEKLGNDENLEIVIVAFNGKRIGLVVDRLLQQKEIVEKPLQKPMDAVSFISGTTIMGNGNVCLVLSIPAIFNFLSNKEYTKEVTV